MLNLISDQVKIAIFLAIMLLLGYVYYDVVVEPRREIASLNVTLKKEVSKQTEIVNVINDEDAKRTEGLIRNVIYDKNVTIGDSGVLSF